MGKTTGIEWTDSTWNPIRGCSRVSEGCRNCYAESVAARFSGIGQAYEGLAEYKGGQPRWTGQVRLIEKHIEDPLRWKAPSKIFVNSMSDLFHPEVKDEWLMKIFAVMAQAPQHTFQVLTKRPERMLEVLANSEVSGYFQRSYGKWPLPNVWWGVSVEDQASANERLPLLIHCNAAVRIVSYEPALGPVDFAAAMGFNVDKSVRLRSLTGPMGGALLHWIICGGESGPHARAMHPDWARDTRDFCASLGISFFFKQWGEWAPWKPGFAAGEVRHMRARDGELFREPLLAGASGTPMVRVGKKAAGASLYGVEWKELPQ